MIAKTHLIALMGLMAIGCDDKVDDTGTDTGSSHRHRN